MLQYPSAQMHLFVNSCITLLSDKLHVKQVVSENTSQVKLFKNYLLIKGCKTL